ncbi:MAG TPA: shikimate dehydrogenase [Chloroflexota bacterium]|nr:shikimate dehydrogenase [Chloroflexota bacterium]
MQDISAALFGFPLGHSVSPAMHHAAAADLGIPLRYQLWPLEAGELDDALQTIRRDPWVGANVTLPHKPAVARLVDRVTPVARRAGAVNTIFKRDGLLWGDNTDVPALARCLRPLLDRPPEEERVLVLGAGGAARAVLVALEDLGCARVALANRTDQKAADLLREMRSGEARGPARITRVPWGGVPDLLAGVSLLVNATSVGLDGSAMPLPDLPLGPGARVFDLVYGQDATPLVRQARLLGFQATDGLWMLVYQAALAFELWTGQKPPEARMHEAALEALRTRGHSP